LLCLWGISRLFGQQPSDAERANVPSIRDMAKTARSNGKNIVVLPTPAEPQLAANTLEDFVDDAMVVTARVLNGKTLPSGSYKNTLTTWYTVRVASSLAGDHRLSPPTTEDVPLHYCPYLPTRS
jgi:hypothetical protein